MSSVINSLVTIIQNNMLFTCIILFFILITVISSLAVIFHKIGQKFWKALIPLYNITTLLSALDIPIWMMLLMIIPFVNFIGLPFMVCLIGWKLGSLCQKNILIKIGLMVLPILFLPILAAMKIDINKPYGADKIVVVPLEPKKEFTLEPVIIPDSIEIPNAMSLSSPETLEKITVKSKEEKPIIEKRVQVTEETLKDHLSKADKDRPTAQDLTFDYNMIYSAQKDEEEAKNISIKENPTLQLLNQAGMVATEVKEVKTDNSTLDYNNLYSEETKEPEIQFPKIHEVILEEASPIDETSMGPIPINQRYDKQNKPLNKVIEAPGMNNIEQQGQITELLSTMVSSTPPIVNNSTNIVEPIVEDNGMASMIAPPPDLNIQSADTAIVQIAESTVPVGPITPEPTVQVGQIVSMNIEEPSSLPVGILMKEDKGKKDELSVVLPKEIPEPIPQSISPEVVPTPTIETEPVLANPTMIFQSNMNSEPILRPAQTINNTTEQLDKICPQCSVKLKRDCPVCIICGYKF